MYLHNILGNTLCWTLWEVYLHKILGKYFLLNTVGRFIYTIYQTILSVEHCWKIYLHQIMGNTLCWTCGKIYLHKKILGNTFCWTLWEDLFTQYTGKYFLLNTVGLFIYTKYWDYFLLNTGKIYLHKIPRNTFWWTLLEDYLHKILGYTLCWTLGRFIYTKYWEIHFV